MLAPEAQYTSSSSNHSKSSPSLTESRADHFLTKKDASVNTIEGDKHLEQMVTETYDTNNTNCNSLSQESQTSVSSKKSPYHNFQKHSVALIKKLAKNLTVFLGNTPSETLAKQMWNIFQTCGIKSKKIIVILFGRADLSCQTYRQLLMSCYFGEVCHKQQEVIHEAQAVLRNKVLAILDNAKVAKQVQRNRHIKAKQQFLAYFNEFIEQIREGPLTRFRMSSKSCQNILEKINTVTSLDESTKKSKKNIAFRKQ